MDFFCIADRQSSIGFRLAGLETREVSTKGEALEALRVALAIETIGVILITGNAASFVKDEIDEVIHRRELPLIVEVPSRGEPETRWRASELVKKLIGISV